jgi:class 3 adenylate cyclase/tetratricopeptide (TPR) repeat protein
MCAACHATNPVGNKFCQQCGGPLVDFPAQYASPKTYTPKHLAERILTSKAMLEGERKQVTVLFADIKGSMELLADRDPEEARRVLDPVLELMMEAVHRFEGTVNQVMGDGIMALFGAPLALEDHAVRACYAALRMRESLGPCADEMRRAHNIEVQIRVGLNSGEVVVRSVGSDLRMDYTAVGQTTHLAARMEQLALPGTIRLTDESARLAEGFVEVKPLGPIPVKGLAETVEVYELMGAGVARTRMQVAVLRGLTRFVGRAREIEHLRRVLQRAADGRGQVVAIVGEAGVGKSRLVYEFTHSELVQDWLILEAPSVSYGKATSYMPVIDLLKGYFKIDDRDDHREMSAKVRGRVLGLDGTLEPLLPPLLALLDVPNDDPTWQSLEPAERRQKTLDSVQRLLLRESQVQPLLVIFEDLHWVDGQTLVVLDNLVESLGTARLMLLVNYRPEHEHRWGSLPAYSQIGLHGLPAESTHELLGTLLGPDPGLAPLTQMLAKRGNPFFLEETVRALVETGALTGERGSYRLTRPVEALQVPATVQAILSARIDRLPAEEKQLLQAASVIGKDVPYALLAAIAEQSEESLREGLAHLEEAEFVYATRLFPDLEHTFKHALTHEVTYGSLLQDRRRRLHAEIAGAIERLYADRLNERVEHLAHHALLGQLWGRAVRYGRQAGNRALERTAAREALAAFEGARTALRELPESAERTVQLIDLCFEMRNALFPLGETDRVDKLLNEAQALAERLGDAQRLGRALAYQAPLQSILGNHARAIEAGERACAIGETVGDLGLRIFTNYYLGWALWFGGDPRRAAEPLRAAMALAVGIPLGERFGLPWAPAAAVRVILAVVLAELGEFEESLAAAQESVLIAQPSGHPYSEVFTRFGLGYHYLRRGHLLAAIDVTEQGLAICRAMEIRVFLPFMAATLGSAYLWSGRTADAVALLEEALAAITAMRSVGNRPLFVALLGEAHLALGHLAEAREGALQAVATARAHPARGWEARGLKLLGDVRARDSAEFEHAEGDYRRALALAVDLGMRPLVGDCHLGLGQLFRRAGKRDLAREHLTSALTTYRGMDMRFWLEQAEAELRLVPC